MQAVVRNHEIDRLVEQRQAHCGRHDRLHVADVGARELDLQVLEHRRGDIDGPDPLHALGERERQ